jgi:hypothetical protein
MANATLICDGGASRHRPRARARRGAARRYAAAHRVLAGEPAVLVRAQAQKEAMPA